MCQYRIGCVFSQKSICVEECFNVKDGVIIKGQMLEPNCYIYGVKLVKAMNNVINVGPSKIFFNKDTSKFTIAIPFKQYGTPLSLSLRKVHFYTHLNYSDISYSKIEGKEDIIHWEKYELVLVQTISFNKLHEKKNELMEKYMTNEHYSFSNNNNNKENEIPMQSSLVNVREGGIAMNFGFDGNNNKQNHFPTRYNNNEGSMNSQPYGATNKLAPGGSSFPSSNFANKFNKGNNQMLTIPEENSCIVQNDSTINSLRKINNNIGMLGNSAHTNMNSGFQNKSASVFPIANANISANAHHINENNQITMNLENKLQQAEMMRNNILGRNTNQQQGSNSSIYQDHQQDHRGDLRYHNNLNNNQQNTLYWNSNNQFNQNNGNSANSQPMNKFEHQRPIEQNLPRNNFPNLYNNGRQDQSSSLLTSKPHQIQSNHITNCQMIPTQHGFKSLLDFKQTTFNFLTNPNKISATDPNFIINLTRIGIGQIQRHLIYPQSRSDFIKILNIQKPKNKQPTNMILTNNLNNIEKRKPVPKPQSFAPLTKSAVKFDHRSGQAKGDNNIYSIDYYIFKDALKNDKPIPIQKEEAKDQNEKNHINYKILDTLGERYLLEQERKDKYNYNPAFEELYRTMSCYDLILTIRGEEITAHKVVLISHSFIFKEMIQKNETRSNTGREFIKIILPDSFSIVIFKDLLKWIYCGRISEGSDINHLRDMLLMADSLKIYPLQKILIVKHIIPNMTKETSIKFLKDTYKKSTPNETAEVWTLLANFSLNCISKNSSLLIKNHRSEFMTMEMDLLFKCVEQSVFYLIEESHLSNLIKLVIDRGYATDIFDLLIKLSKSFTQCRNFHLQRLDLAELLQQVNVNQPVEYFYLTEESVLGENCRKRVPTGSPSSNVLSDMDIKKNKPPTFSFSFELSYDDATFTPCSLFSESFNTNYRSWCLKIDIDVKGDVNFFIVERGMPIKEKEVANAHQTYQDSLSLKYDSVLFEFEVKDISYEKSCSIFFSFSSGQNQIIGHENFFNVKQLGKKDNFLFNIWVKEFPLHAACIQYITDNFQSIAVGKKNEPTDHERIKTLYDLMPSDLSYMLYSDHLKVENENTVMTIIYRYCLPKKASEIEQVMNALRYEYIDLKLLCTTARDHDCIKLSPQFRYNFQGELERRIGKINATVKSKGESKDVFKSLLSEIKEEVKEEEQEKKMGFKLRTNRRRRFYVDDLNRKAFNVTEEIASFFLDKDHHLGYVKEIDRLKKLLEDEKINSEKREASFALQKREMQAELAKISERESKRRRIMREVPNVNQSGNQVGQPDLSNIIATKLSNCIIY